MRDPNGFEDEVKDIWFKFFKRLIYYEYWNFYCNYNYFETLHKVMNLIKKNVAQRNITPNFIRFRSNYFNNVGKSGNKPTTP